MNVGTAIYLQDLLGMNHELDVADYTEAVKRLLEKKNNVVIPQRLLLKLMTPVMKWTE